MTANTTHSTAYDRVLDALRDHGSQVKEKTDKAMAQCPAHDDGRPSLSVTRIDGQTLIHCFAGCQTDDVMAAIDLTTSDLFDNPRGITYRYDDGREVHRTPNKRFFQKNVTTIPELYRRSKVVAAVAADTPVYLVEGEKDVHALESLGVVATTGPQGSQSIGKTDLTPLHGGKVIAVVDRDTQGDKWAHIVADRLEGYCQSLTLVHSATGKDAADHIAAGHEVNELVPYVTSPATEEHASTQESSAGSDGSDGSAGSQGYPLHRGIELADDVSEDGCALLDEIRDWLARHITVMQPSDLDVLTLWAAHTHLSTALFTTPRLQIDSPVPESGKTTVLEHLERLTFDAVMASSISSPALLARLVGTEPRTLLLDEVDRTLDPKKDGTGELIAILNSGYKVGGSRPTLMPVKGGGWQAEELSTFAPVVMAGNQPNLPDDTRTRIIRVLLMPDWQEQAEESDWEIKDYPASMLGARLARWARHVEEQVKERPQMPPGVTGRFREKWQPLARVANAAGGRWLDAVMELSTADVESVRLDREEGLAVEKPAVLLLRHIVNLWPIGEPFWATTDLVDALVTDYPQVWGEESPYGKALTSQRMGRMLVSNYGIRSARRDRADKNSPRGYLRNQFGMAARALSGRPAGSPHPHSEPADMAEVAEPAEKETVACLLHPDIPNAEPGRCIPCEVGA